MKPHDTNDSGSSAPLPFRCPMQEGGQAEILLAWMDRTLEPAALAALDEHATRCESCRGVMDSQKTVWSALDAWEPEAVSSDFNRRLYAAIEAEQKQPWWKRALNLALPFPMRPALPLAASCLLIIGFVLFRAPEPLELENKQANVIERVDIEQVDRSLDDLNLLRELNEELTVDSAGSENL